MKTVYLFLLFLFNTSYSISQDYYSISWNHGGSSYDGVLALYHDGSGMMRVQYFNSYSNQYEAVDQVVYPTRSQEGHMVLAGYQPVYAGTNQLNEYYAADNLYLIQDFFGNIQWVNIDGFGNQSQVQIQRMHANNLNYNFKYANPNQGSQVQTFEEFYEQMKRQNERKDFWLNEYKKKYGKDWADSFKMWH